MSHIKEEIERYVNYFKRKKKYKFTNKEEIDQVLTSDKYLEFVNTVYNFYNTLKSLDTPSEERLSIQCYFEVDQAINSFWNQLLGKKFSEKVNSKSYFHEKSFEKQNF
ncbi:MAG: hypothetical protein KGD63_01200 [Candidatus Lokiarchaeota archaeon]|nr:hypothetical protein [Candidatus Lokiarchaeota archaeon]